MTLDESVMHPQRGNNSEEHHTRGMNLAARSESRSLLGEILVYVVVRRGQSSRSTAQNILCPNSGVVISHEVLSGHCGVFTFDHLTGVALS